MDILFELYRAAPNQGIQWPPQMLILLKRSLESGFLHVQSPPGSVSSFGMVITPNILTLTDKGRNFLNEIGIHEL